MLFEYNPFVVTSINYPIQKKEDLDSTPNSPEDWTAFSVQLATTLLKCRMNVAP